MENLRNEITATIRCGRDLERQSDDAFAVGDVVSGAKLYRWAILCHERADALADQLRQWVSA
jgi:hypothetical protein